MTYFAGEEVGRTGSETPGYWSVPRQYTVPARLVKAGPALVAVRVFDHAGDGGFAGVPSQLWIAPADGSSAPISLAGPWEYKVERALTPRPRRLLDAATLPVSRTTRTARRSSSPR